MKLDLHAGLAALAAGALCSFACAAAEAAGPAFPGPQPGAAGVLTNRPGRVTLENRALSVTWRVDGERLRPAAFQNRLSGKTLPAPREAFLLVRRNGSRIPASRMRMIGPARIEAVAPQPDAARTADRLPGQRLAATLETRDGALRVEWQAILRDGSNYIRQEIAIRPLRGDADLAEAILVDHKLPAADIVGHTSGSPVVAGDVFTSVEHPMAYATVQAGVFGGTRHAPDNVDYGAPECEDDPLPGGMKPLRQGWGAHAIRGGLELALPIKEGHAFACSSVLGVAPKGQLRRGFLYYLERERAHGYRPFLHYNSWYDIGYFKPFSDKDCLDVIDAFGRELVEKRGVKMDSFLFDDGWDDTSRGGEWRFNSGFPHGFAPLKKATAKIGAAPGIWLSPWGGYGDPRIQRVESGRKAGYEVHGEGYETLFYLSGPKYYESFHRACVELVKEQGINQFKLDGTGSADKTVPGSAFGSDFEAAIQLIADLRAIKPDLYINLTTGTWPSPFWLRICDSIWRGGGDHEFVGVGSARQRWITYRDADTYQRVVRGGPLFPLTSVMLHGVLYAKQARKLDKDPEDDFTSEVRSFFGCGTQLQELYVSHGLMTEKNWDTLAQSAKWARANAETLVDVHWVGGDPEKLGVYGWAAWSPAKGILTLRNSSDKPRSITLNLADTFELPEGAARTYRLVAPFPQRAFKDLADPVAADKSVTLELREFEVLIFEAQPVDAAAAQK